LNSLAASDLLLRSNSAHMTMLSVSALRAKPVLANNGATLS
jgi:hypothetical protein